MGYAFLSWILITLLSISFVGEHPLWALGLAALGGAGVGVFLWRHSSKQLSSFSDTGKPWSLCVRIQRYELPLLILPILLLFFSNRLPGLLWVLSFVLLLLLYLCRRIVTGRLSAATPLDLPVLLILFASGVGLYASPDLHLSTTDFVRLVAGVVLFYGLVNGIDSDKKITIAVLIFLGIGIGIVLIAPFIMLFSPSKLPLIPRFYGVFPDLLPRKVHFNYIGGALTFFFPLAFWCFIFKYRGQTIWSGVASAFLGLGLLMTQSRGSLLGTFVATALIGAYVSRWVRWGLLPLAGGIGLLTYRMGIQAILDPMRVAGPGDALAGRKELWNRALYIIQDFPFTGIGMHTFPVVTDMLYPLFLAGPNARVPHAHNLYLQVAVDIGIPGFVAFWMLLGAWGGMMWEALKKTRAGSEGHALRPLVLGLAGGMLAHLLYSVTDAIALGEKAGVVFWALLGLSTAVWRQIQQTTDHRPQTTDDGP